MAQTPSQIDFQKFMADPAYQADREFLEKFFDQHFEKRAREAKERAEKEQQAQPENFFDRLFGKRA